MNKVYKKNNYLIITGPDIISEYLISDIFVEKNELENNYYIYLTNTTTKCVAIVEIPNIFNELNVAYTLLEWENFYTSLSETLNSSVTSIPNTTGSNGTTPYKLISLGTTNANVVKASGGNLYSIVAIGLTSTVRFLKFYNKATAPTVGTDIPVMTIPVPANTQGAGIAIPFSMGVNFPLGISIAITAGPADNDVAVVGAGDVIINLTYA